MLAEQLERRVLGGERCCTRAEIKRRSGVPQEGTERLWRALGFANVNDDDVVFTDQDVEALQLMNMLVGSGLLDPTLEAGAVRAAGQALSRLAEWELARSTTTSQPASAAPSWPSISQRCCGSLTS